MYIMDSQIQRIRGSTTMRYINSHYITHILHVVQLSQRDRAAGWVSFGQKWKTGMRREYFAHIIDLFSTTVT